MLRVISQIAQPPLLSRRGNSLELTVTPRIDTYPKMNLRFQCPQGWSQPRVQKSVSDRIISSASQKQPAPAAIQTMR